MRLEIRSLIDHTLSIKSPLRS